MRPVINNIDLDSVVYLFDKRHPHIECGKRTDERRISVCLCVSVRMHVWYFNRVKVSLFSARLSIFVVSINYPERVWSNTKHIPKEGFPQF
jgi:hypothetical protein